ncbi:MAG: DUF7344 domain-containing protein [Halobacteriota archaeon]|uniref:DUF7344 domain-containing protein n=1 Tax=Natronomonas sp. TaxID=2184060 RepID=UPI00397597CA
MIEAAEIVFESADITSETRPSTELTEDDLFDVLSNRRRRYAIHLIEREGGAVDIGTLAEQIAAWENGIESHGVSCAQRKRVYTALQQIHLPQMADAGVITFDDRSGVVEPTIAMEAMDIYVDLVDGRDVPWSGYYLGLSFIGLAVMTAAWMGVWPLSTLPDIAWGIFMFVTVAVFAVAHHSHMTRQRLGRTEKPAELRYRPSESDESPTSNR